jgi:hypothetical protein
VRHLVIECERPSRKRRRGKGKSDLIDAHLAVLAALRLAGRAADGTGSSSRAGAQQLTSSLAGCGSERTALEVALQQPYSAWDKAGKCRTV